MVPDIDIMISMDRVLQYRHKLCAWRFDAVVQSASASKSQESGRGQEGYLSDTLPADYGGTTMTTQFFAQKRA